MSYALVLILIKTIWDTISAVLLTMVINLNYSETRTLCSSIKNL